ncbi:MAG: hypothetical protein JKY13_03800 [Gammaproteobacteria bacterium]|nr:hypothetical protein [Gammaproteobacteria bacterium]
MKKIIYKPVTANSKQDNKVNLIQLRRVFTHLVENGKAKEAKALFRFKQVQQMFAKHKYTIVGRAFLFKEPDKILTIIYDCVGKKVFGEALATKKFVLIKDFFELQQCFEDDGKRERHHSVTFINVLTLFLRWYGNKARQVLDSIAKQGNYDDTVLADYVRAKLAMKAYQ